MVLGDTDQVMSEVGGGKLRAKCQSSKLGIPGKPEERASLGKMRVEDRTETC